MATNSRVRASWGAGANTPARCVAARRPARRGQRAQALVEFSIVASVFIVLILGIVNFGVAYSNSLVIATAANNAARYAATNHTSSNFDSSTASGHPISASIQGVAINTSASVKLTPTNVTLRYLKLNTSSAPTECATYSESTGTWTADAGYTMYTVTPGSTYCGQPGDLIDVKVAITQNFVAPVLTDIFKNGFTISSEVSTVLAN